MIVGKTKLVRGRGWKLNSKKSLSPFIDFFGFLINASVEYQLSGKGELNRICQSNMSKVNFDLHNFFKEIFLFCEK